MKIVYKKTIEEKIRAIKLEEDLTGKVVDYVLLTPQEAKDLYKSVGTFPNFNWRFVDGSSFYGVSTRIDFA